MDVLTLRTELASLLTAELGTYTLSNAATTAAISVRGIGEPMTPGTTVSGLELIIELDPEPLPIIQYRQSSAFSRWTLWLVQWGAGSGLITEAAQHLVGAYPGSTYEKVPIPAGFGPANQIRVTLQTNPPTTVPAPE